MNRRLSRSLSVDSFLNYRQVSASINNVDSEYWDWPIRDIKKISKRIGLGVAHKLDVTLPLAHLAEFATRVGPLVDDAHPGATVILFGHLGDGNVHVNVVGPAPDDEAVDHQQKLTPSAQSICPRRRAEIQSAVSGRL